MYLTDSISLNRRPSFRGRSGEALSCKAASVEEFKVFQGVSVGMGRAPVLVRAEARPGAVPDFYSKFCLAHLVLAQ